MIEDKKLSDVEYEQIGMEAFTLIGQSRFAEAINYLQDICATYEVDASLWLILGIAFRLSGQPKSALTALERSNSIQNTPECLYEFALNYESLEEELLAGEVAMKLASNFPEWQSAANRFIGFSQDVERRRRQTLSNQIEVINVPEKEADLLVNGSPSQLQYV